MQCPEEELDTIGKQKPGTDEQPDDSPSQEKLGCDLNCRDNYENYKLRFNQCESQMKSDLDTVTLKIDTGDEKKVKYFIDTGVEIYN